MPFESEGIWFFANWKTRIKDGGSDYFPLSVGNKWIYRWCGIDERYATKSYYEVAGQKDDVFYLDNYTYTYFSGSKEEYDALGTNIAQP